MLGIKTKLKENGEEQLKFFVFFLYSLEYAVRDFSYLTCPSYNESTHMMIIVKCDWSLKPKAQ